MIDAADLLRPGVNELRAVLTTPLRNKVQQVARTTDDPLLTVRRNNPYTQPNGLLGPVRLIPYR